MTEKERKRYLGIQIGLIIATTLVCGAVLVALWG